MRQFLVVLLFNFFILINQIFAQDVAGGISTEYGTVIYKLRYPNGVVYTREGVGRVHIQRKGNYDAQWNLTYLGIPGTSVKFAIAVKDTGYDRNQTWVIINGPHSPYNGSGNYTLERQKDVLFVYFFDTAQRSDFVGGYASNGPPASPQNIQANTIVINGESYAKIQWTLSPEEDVSNYPYGSYKVWRRKKITVWENWILKATVSGNVNTFIDTEIYGAGSGPNEVEYKIVAVDRTNHQSEFSDVVSLDWGNSMQKRIASNGINILEDKLIGNFPNPFNPLTKIRYTLKDVDRVSLKIYDILGNKINVLEEEYKLPGEHEISFDGSNLPSGVYLCVLETSRYRSVQKMILSK